jgi:hypothetical protein
LERDKIFDKIKDLEKRAQNKTTFTLKKRESNSLPDPPVPVQPRE